MVYRWPTPPPGGQGSPLGAAPSAGSSGPVSGASGPTRWYFEADGSSLVPAQAASPPVSPAFDAAWGVSAQAVRRFLTPGSAVFGTSMTTTSGITETSAAAVDVLFGQFVSSPLAAQTISGTVKGQFRVIEGSTDADVRAQVVIRVVSNDGATVRGTLLGADDASALSSEFATSLTNRKFPLAATSPAAMTTVNALEGDRLVVEIGYRAHNVLSASKQAQLRYGTAAVNDLAEDETSTSDDRPWIEFQFGLVPSSPSAGFADVRVTEDLVEAVVRDTTPEVRVSQAIVEAVVRDTTAEVRVSQVFAEAVVQAVTDAGYWGTVLELPNQDAL